MPLSRPTSIVLTLSTVLVLVLVLVGHPVARAQSALDSDSTQYRVDSVRVTATGRTNAEAQEKAQTTLRQVAIRRLMRRLVRKQDLPLLAVPDNATLEGMLRSVEVRNERLGSGRYEGNFVVTFSPERVRAWLDSAAIPYSETPPGKILVLPVYREAGVFVIWGRGNHWLDAWINDEKISDSLEFILPDGSPSDTTLLSKTQAVALDGKAIDAIRARYDAKAVLITTATLEILGRSKPRLRFVSRFHFPGTQVQEDTNLVTVSSLPERDQAMALAVPRLVSLVENQWKTADLMTPKEQKTFWLRYRTDTLNNYLRVQRSLEGVAQVQNFSTVVHADGWVLFRLTSSLPLASLNQVLMPVGLELRTPRSVKAHDADFFGEESVSGGPLVYDLVEDVSFLGERP